MVNFNGLAFPSLFTFLFILAFLVAGIVSVRVFALRDTLISLSYLLFGR